MTTRGDVQRALLVFTATTALLFVAIAAVFVWGYIDSKNRRGEIARNAAETRGALCALRADLDKRIASSQDFLREHPRGIPGIPASLIQQGLNNSKRTRSILAVLDC